ncbi:uncharacterized protein LOC108164968 isoform X1 [Drosophila miranda]|uniref:uncharacterized protein LOC108164968 isoform X1 n=1 Tax=Drosophila miranda TaxID=7229 RepID=UPI00143F486C|nr:uncharacterized protein LOC108164968 isoform X1 [Drosophila miranda]XP_033249581.1 uncharacterized protein LOC108164968 isoform X1 [Drosophila miranda]
MPPKKNSGARRRGTTLSLNEFLRHDDDSNPTDPTCDPNPPMATNGSSRSRNDQPSNRSCDNARRNVGKLSPSAVGPHRSNPFNPTDTKPPMATYGSNRSRNSAHQYNDQTSIAAVGSNRSGNKSRRNGDRPSASAVGSNRSRRESNPPNPTDTNPQSHQFGGPAGSNGSDNRTLQNYENPKIPNTAELGYNQLFRPGVQSTQIFGYTIAASPDQLLNSPTPEPTDTDPPMAANGASFSSINTPQNDAPPETSADGNSYINCHQNDDGPTTYAAAAAANRQDLTGAAPSVWVSPNSPLYPYQGGAPMGTTSIGQYFGLEGTPEMWNLAAPLALQASNVNSSQNLVMRQAVVGPSQNLVMRQAVVDPLNLPPFCRRRGQRYRHGRGRRGKKFPKQFEFMVDSIPQLESHWNDQQKSYSGNLPPQCYNVEQESYNGYSQLQKSALEQQYIDESLSYYGSNCGVQPQSYNGADYDAIAVADQQQITTIYHRGRQQIINIQNRNGRIESAGYGNQQVATQPSVLTRRIHPREQPQPPELSRWEGTKISMRRRLQRRRRKATRHMPSVTVEIENALSMPEPPLETLYCNCNFSDQYSISQTTANSVSSPNPASFLAVPFDQYYGEPGRFHKMNVQMLIPPGRIDIPEHISTSMVMYNPESGAIAARLDSEPVPAALENNNYNVSQSVFRMASLPSTGVGTNRAGAGSTCWAGCSLPSSRCGHDREWRFLSSWCHTPIRSSFHTGQFQARRPPFSQHPARSLLQIQINAITQSPVPDSTSLCRQKGLMNTPYRSLIHENEKFPLTRGSSPPIWNSFARLSKLLQVQGRKQELVIQMSFLRCSIHSSIQTFQNTFHGGFSQDPKASLKLVAMDLEDTKTTNQEQVKVKDISLVDVKEKKGALRITTKSFPILSTDAQGPLPTGPTSTVPTYTQYSYSYSYSRLIDYLGVAAPADRSLISHMSTQKHSR